MVNIDSTDKIRVAEQLSEDARKQLKAGNKDIAVGLLGTVAAMYNAARLTAHAKYYKEVLRLLEYKENPDTSTKCQRDHSRLAEEILGDGGVGE